MDRERLTQIVRYALGVASEADEWNERELGPIHLLKFAYLADLAHAKRTNGQTFTGVPWRFYNLGPWDEGAHAAVESAANDSGAAKRTFDWGGEREGIRWGIADSELASGLRTVGDRLPLEVASAIRAAVKKYGADTYHLLDDVYLTKPMLHAAPGERLDFSVVVTAAPEPADEVPVAAEGPPASISKSEAKRRHVVWTDLRDALRERVRAGGARRRRLVPAPTAPIYDEVFAAGVAALDEMAGSPIPKATGTVTFSPDIWKSRGRRESDIS